MRTNRVAGVEVGLDHWIGGERIGSKERFEDVSPIDESLIAEVARGAKAEAEAAVEAALGAFPGWARTSREERAALLHAIADGVEARIPELAIVETTDNGGLLRSNLRGVMPRVVHNFRFFADWLLKLGQPDFETRAHRNHVTHDPAGVAVLIAPWNAPLMLETWKVAPALAAGDTVILKPAEWAPLTASLLADITAEAGLPPGVFNVVHGLGEEAGAVLVADPRVRRISFTGSVATAREIGAVAGRNLVPVSFELGGKSPLLVLDDADLDLAISLAIEQYDNAGQVCLAGTRLLVQDGIADDFLEGFLERARSLIQGDPREDATDLGPQITRSHLERVDGYVMRARADGARALIGGEPNHDLGGLYYRPTLLVDAPAGSEILTQEVFGPVLTLERFARDEQALDMANATDYGLAAVIVSGDEDRAARLSAGIVSGTTWVNCFYVRDLAAPFGGSKLSGIGREGGDWSFDFYSDVKNTVYAPRGWKEAGSG